VRRKTNGQQSHDQRPNAYQRRHYHSVHVRPPGFSITLTASAVKLIPTLTAVERNVAESAPLSELIEGDDDVRDKDDGDPVFGDRLPADGRCGVGRIV
jgi:hypothetical protein